MSLRVRFWGPRGSIPSPGPDTVRYGGNTPSVEIRTEAGWLVILDGGTGIRALGEALLVQANGSPIEGDIFLTHAHWDHIQGIPFFAPIFQRGNHFTISGSASLSTSIDRVVRDLMSPVVFPVSFEELAALVDFREIAAGATYPGTGYEVTAFDVRHPGGALESRDAFGEYSEPRKFGRFLAAAEQGLHPKANSQKRHARLNPLDQRFPHAHRIE